MISREMERWLLVQVSGLLLPAGLATVTIASVFSRDTGPQQLSESSGYGVVHARLRR